MPRRLPITYKGEPLACLSNSSIAKFLTCPDDWRRHYILGERAAPSGSMFLGSRVDDALTAFYRAQIEGGKPLDLDQLRDIFNESWQRSLAEEQSAHGQVRWDEGTDERWTFNVGLEAIAVCLKRIVPQLGEPLYAQRRFEFRLAPGLEWTVVGYVDLDTIREQKLFLDEHGTVRAVQDPGTREPSVEVPWDRAPKDLRPALQKSSETHSEQEAIAYQDPVDVPASLLRGEIVRRQVVAINDYKAKNDPIHFYKAARDPQPTLYLAEKALIQHDPAYDFTFAQVLKPKAGKRQHVSEKVVRTRRTQHQLEGFFARIAMVATQINALHETLGPERPWGFAAPGTWKCEPNSAGTEGKYCAHWSTCPAGAGL